MLILLLAYASLVLTIGLLHLRYKENFREFVTAGESQGGLLITLSLLASIIGGSATLGIVDLTLKIGFPAFWWLSVGSIGLLLQAWLIAPRIRSMNACTLPHIAGIVAGAEARVLTGSLIVLAWIGIIAAQLIALSQILSVFIGVVDTRLLLIAITLLVLVYTACGGQLSVLRTDALQVILVYGGVVAACACLYYNSGGAELRLKNLELLNDQFQLRDLFSLFLLVGSTYFIGPDIFSRNLSARDIATARRSSICAAGLLFLFSLLIVSTGLWASSNGLHEKNVLLAIARDHLASPVAILLGFGLISAIISSLDTCLMSAAAIFEHDVLKSKKVNHVRIFILLIGGIALCVALCQSDIIGLLLCAYSIYAPGIVAPLFVAIMAHRKRPLRRVIWLAGVGVGGICGILSEITNASCMALIGMAFSASLSIFSILPGVKRKNFITA